MKTYEEAEVSSRSDSEITLGMRSILGIFLGLVLICGVFFGFGYSLGRGNADKEPSAAEAALHPLKAAHVSAEKLKTVVERPSAADSLASETGTETDDRGARLTNSAPAASKHSQAKPLAASPFPASARPSPTNETQVVESPNDAGKTASSKAALPTVGPNSGSAAAGTGEIMVQIAAVSHQADADVLVSALGRLGYSASVHSESTDNLLHVQIGPFATRDEAKATRTKLLNDGYNAILK